MRLIRNILWIMALLGVWSGLSAQHLRVGDLFIAPDGSKGIVYYLHPDGSGGWAVALKDATASNCIWGSMSNVPGLADQNFDASQILLDTAGYTNTQQIRAHYQDNLPYAAGIVDFENGWVLPSPAQLQMLYVQLPFVSPAIVAAGGIDLYNAFYWTSAEVNTTTAWAVSFASEGYSGAITDWPKNGNYRVRAVRSFTYPLYVWSTGAGSPSITVAPEHTTDYTVTVMAGHGSQGSATTTVFTNPTFDTVMVETACDTFTWNGTTYTESGFYTMHLTASNGCDSSVTLRLTLGKTPQVSLTATDDTVCLNNNVTLQASATNVYVAPMVAVGDILCTDGTFVKPSSWSLDLGKTAQGVVFYVDNSGEHGWAVHLNDQETSAAWTPSGQYVDIPTLDNYANAREAMMDLDGYGNTQTILAETDLSTCPAAHAVDFENGWYMPSAGQMRLLFSEIIKVNDALQIVSGTPFPMDDSFYYWTSTESNESRAFVVHSTGNLTFWSKYFAFGVRSVRNF
ncbi:MAG: hypothetical protein J6X98_04655 [Bacteroidales bacterium]|nr:hypothetical protein [Bacteroidales bacterium]